MATDRILDPTETARTAVVNRCAYIMGISTVTLLQEFPAMKSNNITTLKAAAETVLLQYFGIPIGMEDNSAIAGDYYKMKSLGKAVQAKPGSNEYFLVPSDAPELPTGYGKLPFMTYKVIVGSITVREWWPTWYFLEGSNFEPTAENLAYMMFHLQSWVNKFSPAKYDCFTWNSKSDGSGFSMPYLIYQFCCFNRLKVDKPWGVATYYNLPVSKKIDVPGWQYAFVYYDDISSYWVNVPFYGDNNAKKDNFKRMINALIAQETDYPYRWLNPFTYQVTSADRFWDTFESVILAVSVWIARLIPIIGVGLGIVITKVTEKQKLEEIEEKVKAGVITRETANEAVKLVDESNSAAGVLKSFWERLVRLFQQYGVIILLPLFLLVLGLYYLFRKKHS